MNVSRRTFLGTTSAFTSVNLFHPEASAPIDCESIQGDHWRQVWFGRAEINSAELANCFLPTNPILSLDSDDWEKIKAAKPGQGLAKMQTRTTHFVPAPEGSWG